MWDSLAPSFSPAELAPSFLPAEPASSLRLVSPPPVSSPTASSASSLVEAPSDFPLFEADALFDTPRGDVLRIRLPGQPTPDERGWLRPHLVLAYLHPNLVLELALHQVLRRGPELVAVGVWAAGDYAHWERERELDFVVLDAVDLALRRQLPARGGVLMFQHDFLASGAGVSFHA